MRFERWLFRFYLWLPLLVLTACLWVGFTRR